MDAADWTARWIEPVEPEGGPVGQRPAYHLAGEVSIDEPFTSAVLRVTAHGLYEAFVSGARVGDVELAPGFTAYRSRLQVHTYDVTELLVEGSNALGALLSDGWWRGQHGIVRALDAYGPTTALLAQLDVTLASGASLTFGTDGTWRSTPSHVLAADLIAGEVHDLRRRVPGWCAPGTDRSGWDDVRVVDHGYAELCAVQGPPTRRVEELPATSVTEVGPRRHVVDFGQNSNGWVRLTDLGPEGTTVTLTYGEALDTAGDVTQANVAEAPLSMSRDLGLPFQVDVVTSAGDGATFEPRHSTKGFRYVRVEGHPGPLEPSAITSVVVHTDLRPIGGFECSDARLNRLHRAAVWSFRGNACEIPTDCPTRERSGWVGDWQLYIGTAAFIYDVFDWSARWLQDLAADQWPDGRVTSIVPDPSPHAPMWEATHGSSGWGDAAVHVPWELHRATGRTDVLAEQLPSMQRWVDFAAGQAAARRHRMRVERSAEPLPHEQFLWDTGWHFGEWLEPGVDLTDVFGGLARADHGPVATAYLHRSAAQLAAVGELLGDDHIASTYGTLAANVVEAWRTEFIDDDGRVQPQSQANLVRALEFGLVPDDLRARTAADLVDLVRAAGTHLGTGFLATPFLLPVLADHGHLDVAYELLLQDTEPSWLYMTEHGATTIWEEWAGVKPDGSVSASLNHYSKGAVISFLHRYVAGLQIVEPGYRRFRVAPRPGGGITHTHATHESPHGRIDVAWSTSGSDGRLDMAVPAGTEADLVLPDGTTDVLPPGYHHRTWRAG
jgi:alpha-L-rhamnosidase